MAAGSALKRNLVALSEARLVQHVIGGRPTTIADGVSILSWRTNDEFSAPYALVNIEANAICQLTAPAHGAAVELFGYRTVFGWRRIGYLNDAQLIDIPVDLIGHAQQANVIGVYERLCVAAAVSNGAQAIAKFAPLEYYT